jgi:CBS domain-containing protein
VLLGWFLREAARAESTHELLHGALASVRVRDVMTADPVVVPADVLVADLVDEWFLGRRCSAFPVVGPDGTTTGLVTMQDVRRTNRHAWTTLRATDIASRITDVATAAPDEMLPALLERVAGARAGDGRALVFDGTRLVGIVSSTDLRRAMEAAALHRPPLHT